uniref:Uncharacterized protein n=1 Tax=Plectus sambesii TaxID=2011161 RepID=A0A914W7N4_9BILA
MISPTSSSKEEDDDLDGVIIPGSGGVGDVQSFRAQSFRAIGQSQTLVGWAANFRGAAEYKQKPPSNPAITRGAFGGRIASTINR